MRTFLFKTEPSEYAFDDLVRDKRTAWSGVTNAAALQFLRAARVNDEAFIYHTGEEKAIVGLARVAKAPYEDPEHPGTTPEDLPKRAVVDIKPVRACRTPLSLAQIKSDKRFAEFALVKNSRLSVMLVPGELAGVIRELCGL